MPDDTAIYRAKMAEPIEMLFGLWTWMGRRKHVLHGKHIGATWRLRLNRLFAVTMWPYVKLLDQVLVINTLR